jgi:hypothetical protein
VVARPIPFLGQTLHLKLNLTFLRSLFVIVKIMETSLLRVRTELGTSHIWNQLSTNELLILVVNQSENT